MATLPLLDLQTLECRIQGYLFDSQHGPNLRSSLERIPIESLSRFYAVLLKSHQSSSRVFFIGNGGSYDNARLMVGLFRDAGIKASVPGNPDDYFNIMLKSGYDEIYKEALERENLGPQDIVVGLSGSGNSPNIVKALAFTKSKGASAFAFGGRDGGKMREVCGEEFSVIVTNACMEAIEDLHLFLGIVCMHALKDGLTLEMAKDALLTNFDTLTKDGNIKIFAKLLSELLRTIRDESRVFVLGIGIGTNHIRADLGRGATNALPIRGICAPEFFSMNSAQATSNDDGPYNILVDGLVKYSACERDFALLAGLGISDALMEPVKKHLIEKLCPYIPVGDSDESLHLPGQSGLEKECFLALVGHICGEVIRGYLWEVFKVRVLSVSLKYESGKRKLDPEETCKLEEKLKVEGVLGRDEVVTFAYGKAHAALDPRLFSLNRCYY